MIQTFRHKGLRTLFRTGDHRGIMPGLKDRLLRTLDAIDAAGGPGDLDLPGFALHGLKGNRSGTWSIRVTGNWRLTFRFADGDTYDVDLEDYH